MFTFSLPSSDRRSPKIKRAFTLVEVLTVILIIGILTTITTTVYNSSLARSRDTQRLTDLKSIQNTLEQYYLDKRSYPNYQHSAGLNDGGYPWVAKFELERFPNGTWPGCTQTDSPKTYIAPKYITSIPEDPKNKMVVDGDCKLIGTGTPGAYQYQYIPFMAVDDITVAVTKGYYLMAKMERTNNVVPSLVPVRNKISTADYAFTRTVIDLPTVESGNPNHSWPALPYFYCSQGMTGSPTSAACHINYFLSNADK